MTTVMRSDDVRKGNRRRILEAVRRKSGLSRTDIQHTTGLSAASVSAITSSLIDEGILVSPQTRRTNSTGRGRPKVSLALNASAAMVGTLIFRHNTITAAVANYAGDVVGQHAMELVTADAAPEELKSALTTSLMKAVDQAGLEAEHLKRISVGVQGVIDIAGTSLLWSPITREKDLPLKAWLEDVFNIPVQIANDCDLISQALNWRDPVRYGKNFATILLADGVGMGLFLRGRLINGTKSSGTEFGHMTYLPGGALCRCGSLGCIEAYASAYAIIRHALKLPDDKVEEAPKDTRSIALIVEKARAGNPDALEAIEMAGEAIGTGLANIYALVDPFPVVIAGSGGTAFDLMEPALRRSLEATVAGKQTPQISIDCFTDESPLVMEGCLINALIAQDYQFADFGTSIKGAAE